MVYLASPYTDEHPEIMEIRYGHVMEITAYLIRKGYVVFSPIVHCHVLANKYLLPKNFEFWQKYNESAIVSCESFMVAAIDSWEKSVGVRSEYNLAVREGKEVGLITPLKEGKYIIINSLTENLYKFE